MSARRLFLGLCVAVLGLALLAWALHGRYLYAVNLSESLPQRLFVVQRGAPVRRGDLVAFRWQGGLNYPAGTLFIKRVVGLPGDRVGRSGEQLWVNEVAIGRAKPFSRSGLPLQPAVAGVIAPGTYFVATANPDSLDSRYAQVGNIRQAALVGRAYAIF